MNDIAIIGAGASGLCCAIMLKQKNSNLNVTVFEANDRVCKKLAVTGNGRCNITNTKLSPERYHGDSDFAFRIISQFDFQKQRDFFEKLGIPFTYEDEKAFPMSLQANSVVDVLRFEAEELGVCIKLSYKVSSVNKKDDCFYIDNFKYDAVIIATGGKAGIKKFDTAGYDILRKFGHKIEPISPSLVQIKTDTQVIKQLKGVKIKGKITIVAGDVKKSEFGEILFCDYGLSGPPVLQISRMANCKDSKVLIDFLPEYTNEELKSYLKKRKKLQPNRIIAEFFTGFLNKRIGQVALKLAKCDINANVETLTESQILKVVGFLKSFEVNVCGTNGFDNAQVTAGGAQTTQFFDSLMSKKVKGLFAVGEILNVDGDCGGFNLAFAWASANAASNGVLYYLKKRD